MITEPATPGHRETRWRRLLAWLDTVDAAFEFDPTEHATSELKARIETMERTMRDLEARLAQTGAVKP